MTSLRIGVIGFGVSARYFHLPILTASSDYQLCGIVSTQSAALAAHYPRVPIFSSFAILLDEKPDIVVITTPSSTHHEYARHSLERGIHTVVEKPFVCSVAEGQELISMAQAKGALLTVFHNRRWDNGYLSAQKLLAQGRIGHPRLFLARFDRFRTEVNPLRWRDSDSSGGGALYDIGSHLVDQALSLFGPPTEVRGHYAIQRPQGIVDDYFHISMRFHHQAYAELQSSCFVHGDYPHLELHGTTGSYVKYKLDPQETQARAGMRPNTSEWGIEPPEAQGILSYSHDGCRVDEAIVSERGNYPAFYEVLARAVRIGGPVPVRPEDALAVVSIIEQIRSGKA